LGDESFKSESDELTDDDMKKIDETIKSFAKKADRKTGWQSYQEICHHKWFKPYVNEDVEMCALCGLTRRSTKKGVAKTKTKKGIEQYGQHYSAGTMLKETDIKVGATVEYRGEKYKVVEILTNGNLYKYVIRNIASGDEYTVPGYDLFKSFNKSSMKAKDLTHDIKLLMGGKERTVDFTESSGDNIIVHFKEGGDYTTFKENSFLLRKVAKRFGYEENVPNNQEKISSEIKSKYGSAVTSTYDDGAVIIHTKDEKIADEIERKYSGKRIGDGVQEGGLWINGVEKSVMTKDFREDAVEDIRFMLRNGKGTYAIRQEIKEQYGLDSDEVDEMLSMILHKGFRKGVLPKYRVGESVIYNDNDCIVTSVKEQKPGVYLYTIDDVENDREVETMERYLHKSVKKSMTINKTRTKSEVQRDIEAAEKRWYEVPVFDTHARNEIKDELDRLQTELSELVLKEQNVQKSKEEPITKSVQPTFSDVWKGFYKSIPVAEIDKLACQAYTVFGAAILSDLSSRERVIDWLLGKGIAKADANKVYRSAVIKTYLEQQPREAIFKAEKKEDVKEWITVGGRHIPVKEGQTKDEAVNSKLKIGTKNNVSSNKEKIVESSQYIKDEIENADGSLSDEDKKMFVQRGMIELDYLERMKEKISKLPENEISGDDFYELVHDDDLDGKFDGWVNEYGGSHELHPIDSV
jgi:hypothetical protein